MTSLNNPLGPNQITQSILRMRDPAIVDRLAGMAPWQLGDDVPLAQRLEVSNNIANALGLQAGPKGGLGTRGPLDYSRIADLAKMWQVNPDWFRKGDAEPWANYLERLMSQVPGYAAKTGSFATVWQNPAVAGLSAIDRHMVNLLDRDIGLFTSPQERAGFEQNAVAQWDKDKPRADRVQSFDQVPEGFVTKMKLSYVGKTGGPLLRLASGELNPDVPEHPRNVDWIHEPTNVMTMGEPYARAINWNERLAEQQGFHLFPSQWFEWDRIRRRFEPHQNMFPGLENMPAMSRDQLREVVDEMNASGHLNYSKTEGPDGSRYPQPTKPRPNPGRFVTFSVPPIAAGIGWAGMGGDQGQAAEH